MCLTEILFPILVLDDVPALILVKSYTVPGGPMSKPTALKEDVPYFNSGDRALGCALDFLFMGLMLLRYRIFSV